MLNISFMKDILGKARHKHVTKDTKQFLLTTFFSSCTRFHLTSVGRTLELLFRDYTAGIKHRGNLDNGLRFQIKQRPHF